MNNFNKYTIESKRLVFKPLNLSHLSIKYVNWMNDKDVNNFLESGGDYTLEKLKFFLINRQFQKNYMWAIHIKNSNQHIGNIKIDPNVTLGPMELRKDCGQLGILIGEKSQWGKGYAYETSKKIIDFCFEQLGIKRIVLGVKRSNLNAVKLYKKIGFDFFEKNEYPEIYSGIPEDAIIMGFSHER